MSQPLRDKMVPAARSPETRAIEPSEFGVFYRRWHAQLLDFVMTTCGARDAEEIAQETMARALTAMDFSRDPESQWRWLRVVARNVAADLSRARKLCDVTSDEPGDVDRVAAINVEQQLLDSECLQELHHVLTALSPKQSQAWWLTIAEGMPPTAIAATLGCSPESVRQALFKTRRKLASAMAMFVERAEGFGAFGVLAVMARRIRSVARPVTRTAAPAPLALAAAGVVGTLAFLSLPAHLGGTVHMPKTMHPSWHAAADTQHAHVNRRIEPVASSSSGATDGRATNLALPAPVSQPATAAWISRQPLRAGRTATIQVGATTPFGSVAAQTTLTRTSRTGLLCGHVSAVYCN